MNHLVAVAGIVFVGLSPIWVALADVSPATAALFRSVYALPTLTLIGLLGARDIIVNAAEAKETSHG